MQTVPLRRSSIRLHILCATAVALLAGTATVARADWLLTKEGARIRTKGPWKIQGTMVVFSLPNGSLSSIKSAEIDVEGSTKLTKEAAAVAAVPAPTKAEPPGATAALSKKAIKKPAITLTDKDVAHVTETGETVKAEKGGEAAKPGEPARVSIGGWERTPTGDGNGSEIFGSLRNDSKQVATDIEVTAKIFDDQGTLLGTAEAAVSSNSIAPGQSGTFRATFPGIPYFESATFDVTSRGLIIEGIQPPPEPGADNPST